MTDDTLHYDTGLEEHWWRTIDLLTTYGRAGAVLNPDKVQFSQQDVDFAGFHISEERIEPLTKYYAAIRDFPVPTSTKHIRNWFGLAWSTRCRTMPNFGTRWHRFAHSYHLVTRSSGPLNSRTRLHDRRTISPPSRRGWRYSIRHAQHVFARTGQKRV